MSLTPRDAFKLGFVKQCRDAGLTDAQIVERAELALQKQAGVFDALDRATGPLRDAGSNIWRDVHTQAKPDEPKPVNEFNKRLLALSLGTVGVGAGLGALGSKLKGNFVDEDDVKNQEVIDELRRQTELGKQNQRAAHAPQS